MMYVYNTYLGISSPPQFPDVRAGGHTETAGVVKTKKKIGHLQWTCTRLFEAAEASGMKIIANWEHP